MVEASMATPTRPRKNEPWSRPLADFVGKTLDPLAQKRGFGESDIILHWAAIVGERLAAVSEPARVQWPVRGPKTPPDAPIEPATLHIRVEGSFALEFQHLAPVLCERVNARLGWRCVNRISLQQGPIERRERGPRPKFKASAEASAQAAALTEGVADEELRAALLRLGERALTKAPGPR